MYLSKRMMLLIVVNRAPVVFFADAAMALGCAASTSSFAYRYRYMVGAGSTNTEYTIE